MPKVVWPRPYLLEAYNLAIDEGCAELVQFGGPQRAASFIGSFYRLRRKSDKEIQANYIRPEFDLVTADYDEENDRVVIVYSRVPSDMGNLPTLRSLPAGGAEFARPEVKVSTPAGMPLLPEEDFSDIEAAVRRLAEESANKPPATFD